MPEEAVLDAPASEPEVAEVSTPDAGDQIQPTAENTDAATQPETGADKGEAAEPDIYAGENGQKIPPKFAGLFKQHPELRSMFFENREIREHGGVKKLLEAATTLDEIGGREAVQHLESEIGTWEKMDEAFSAGDPALAAHLFEADPEAAAKIAPAFIEHFAKSDPDGYSHVLGRAMLNTMQGMGVYGAITDLAKLAEGNADVKKALGPLVQLWNAVFDVAQKLPDKTADPERQKFEAEREAFANERATAFARDVISDAKGAMESAMESTLGKSFKQGGIDLAALRNSEPEMWQMVVDYCDKKVADAINRDRVFQQNKEALHRGGDGGGLKKLYRAKIEAVMPGIAKDAYSRFTRFGAPAKTGAAQPKPQPNGHGAQPSRPGEIRLPKPPTAMGLKIDFHRVPPGFADIEAAVMAGRAYVKGRPQLHVWQ